MFLITSIPSLPMASSALHHPDDDPWPSSAQDLLLPPRMHTPENDDESLDYSFALVYTGPRPAFVPKAEHIPSRFSSSPLPHASASSLLPPFDSVPVQLYPSQPSSQPHASYSTDSAFATERSPPSFPESHRFPEPSSAPRLRSSANDPSSSIHVDMAAEPVFPGSRHARSSEKTSSCFSYSSKEGSSSGMLNLSMQETSSNFTSQQRKGGCYGCSKSSRIQDKEACLVCGAKYCITCVAEAMGSMPEGRKCVRCIGRRIDESRRPSLGKPSRLLNRLFSAQEVHQIMKAEKECETNQISPGSINVNNKQLTATELAKLLGCGNPPSMLKPGRYWYDQQCGYWGKEGEKPHQIITTQLKVGGNMDRKASSGTTQVCINGREITKVELKMLKLAGVQCPPGTHLWVEPTGAYQEEGQNNSPGNIWGTATTRFLYFLCSLPTPYCNHVGPENSTFVPLSLTQAKRHKILLLGSPGSGTSAIFKQVKSLYGGKYTPEELQSLKSMIQSNIYKYIITLLEARERFEEEANVTTGSLDTDKSENGDVYNLNPRLKTKADWFLDIGAKGEFEFFFPAATREYAPVAKEIWNDPAIQATYARKAEIPMLPDVTKYFLDQIQKITTNDYQPSDRDILYAEGTDDGLGLAELEFCMDESKTFLSGPLPERLHQLPDAVRYHLIRVNGHGMVNGCKWVDMFDAINAVIFCVALDSYDLMTADGEQNEMMLSRELFENILKFPCFQGKPVVLFLNKYDIFEEKVHEIPLTRCQWFADFNPVRAPHYSSQYVAQLAYTFIAHKFKKHFEKIIGHKLYTFKVVAWEQPTVEEAFQYVKEVLGWEESKKNDESSNIHEDSMYNTETGKNSLWD